MEAWQIYALVAVAWYLFALWFVPVALRKIRGRPLTPDQDAEGILYLWCVSPTFPVIALAYVVAYSIVWCGQVGSATVVKWWIRVLKVDR